MNKTRSRKLLILLSWAAVIFWLAFIFNLSAQPAVQSDVLSKKVTKAGIGAVEKVAPNSHFKPWKINKLLRKNAHFFTYLVLSILVINALRRSGFQGWRWFFLALGFCILYAVSDEIHQFYVPGRGAQIEDMLIDSAGVLAGGVLYQAVGKVKLLSGQLRGL